MAALDLPSAGCYHIGMHATTYIVLRLVLAVLAAAGAGAQEPDGQVLARVNGQAITRADLDRHVRVFYARLAAEQDSVTTGVFDRSRALEDLIDRRLLLQAAETEYLGEESISTSLKNLADEEYRKFEERSGSKLKAAAQLAALGLTVDEFKQIQTDEVLIGKFLWDEAQAKLSVSPAEIRRYYNAHPEEFTTPRTVIYRQAFIPVVDESEQAACRAEAELVLSQVLAGKEFETVAGEYLPDGGSGGLHTVQVPESEPDWLPPAVERLEVGQTSDVREIAGGFSIARLEEVRPAGVRPFDEVQADISAKLLAEKRARARRNLVDDLRRKGQIEYVVPEPDAVSRTDAP